MDVQCWLLHWQHKLTWCPLAVGISGPRSFSRAHDKEVNCIAFNPLSEWVLATGSTDQMVREKEGVCSLGDGQRFKVGQSHLSASFWTTWSSNTDPMHIMLDNFSPFAQHWQLLSPLGCFSLGTCQHRTASISSPKWCTCHHLNPITLCSRLVWQMLFQTEKKDEKIVTHLIGRGISEIPQPPGCPADLPIPDCGSRYHAESFSSQPILQYMLPIC